MDQENLSKMKVNELKRLAKNNNLRAYSKLKKNELINLLLTLKEPINEPILKSIKEPMKEPIQTPIKKIYTFTSTSSISTIFHTNRKGLQQGIQKI